MKNATRVLLALVALVCVSAAPAGAVRTPLTLDHALTGVQPLASENTGDILLVDPATPEPEREELRADLFQYCSLDTMAMLEVLRRLRALSHRPNSDPA